MSVISRKRVLTVVVVVIALIALYSGWHFYQAARQPLTLYGNVDIREVNMGFRQPGRLMSVKVKEGDKVKKGQILALLDDVPYRHALAQAEAEVAKAQAELQKLEAGNRQQDIKVAAAAVTKAQAVLQQSEAELKRQQQLVKAGDASEKTLEQARRDRDVAVASLASAQQTLSLQKSGARIEEIAAARANLQGAQAKLSQARTALNDTVLSAPDDAVVMSRVREPGSMLSTQDAVYTLSLRKPVYVRAYVDEPALGKIAQGMRVFIYTDSSAKVYSGQIGFISPRAEFTPKSVETTDLRTDLVYRLRITVLNDDDALKQGMPVTIRFDSKGV